MGVTYVIARIGKGEKARDVELLVDSGATYTLLPEKIWKDLGLKPMAEMTFMLANGEPAKRKISEVWFEYEGMKGTTRVILGEGSDEALLGAFTLEMLGLVLNPFSRELIPMRMMLASKTSMK